MPPKKSSHPATPISTAQDPAGDALVHSEGSNQLESNRGAGMETDLDLDGLHEQLDLMLQNDQEEEGAFSTSTPPIPTTSAHLETSTYLNDPSTSTHSGGAKVTSHTQNVRVSLRDTLLHSPPCSASSSPLGSETFSHLSLSNPQTGNPSTSSPSTTLTRSRLGSSSTASNLARSATLRSSASSLPKNGSHRPSRQAANKSDSSPLLSGKKGGTNSVFEPPGKRGRGRPRKFREPEESGTGNGKEGGSSGLTASGQRRKEKRKLQQEKERAEAELEEKYSEPVWKTFKPAPVALPPPLFTASGRQIRRAAPSESAESSPQSHASPSIETPQQGDSRASSSQPNQDDVAARSEALSSEAEVPPPQSHPQSTRSSSQDTNLQGQGNASSRVPETASASAPNLNSSAASTYESSRPPPTASTQSESSSDSALAIQSESRSSLPALNQDSNVGSANDSDRRSPPPMEDEELISKLDLLNSTIPGLQAKGKRCQIKDHDQAHGRQTQRKKRKLETNFQMAKKPYKAFAGDHLLGIKSSNSPPTSSSGQTASQQAMKPMEETRGLVENGEGSESGDGNSDENGRKINGGSESGQNGIELEIGNENENGKEKSLAGPSVPSVNQTSTAGADTTIGQVIPDGNSNQGSTQEPHSTPIGPSPLISTSGVDSEHVEDLQESPSPPTQSSKPSHDNNVQSVPNSTSNRKVKGKVKVISRTQVLPRNTKKIKRKPKSSTSKLSSSTLPELVPQPGHLPLPEWPPSASSSFTTEEGLGFLAETLRARFDFLRSDMYKLKLEAFVLSHADRILHRKLAGENQDTVERDSTNATSSSGGENSHRNAVVAWDKRRGEMAGGGPGGGRVASKRRSAGDVDPGVEDLLEDAIQSLADPNHPKSKSTASGRGGKGGGAGNFQSFDLDELLNQEIGIGDAQFGSWSSFERNSYQEDQRDGQADGFESMDSILGLDDGKMPSFEDFLDMEGTTIEALLGLSGVQSTDHGKSNSDIHFDPSGPSSSVIDSHPTNAPPPTPNNDESINMALLAGIAGGSGHVERASAKNHPNQEALDFDLNSFFAER